MTDYAGAQRCGMSDKGRNWNGRDPIRWCIHADGHAGACEFEPAAPTLRAQIEALRKHAALGRYDTVELFEQTAWNGALDAVLALLPAPEKAQP